MEKYYRRGGPDASPVGEVFVARSVNAQHADVLGQIVLGKRAAVSFRLVHISLIHHRSPVTTGSD